MLVGLTIPELVGDNCSDAAAEVGEEEECIVGVATIRKRGLRTERAIRCRMEGLHLLTGEVLNDLPLVLSFSPLDINAFVIALRQGSFPLLVILAFLTFGAM